MSVTFVVIQRFMTWNRKLIFIGFMCCFPNFADVHLAWIKSSLTLERCNFSSTYVTHGGCFWHRLWSFILWFSPSLYADSTPPLNTLLPSPGAWPYSASDSPLNNAHNSGNHTHEYIYTIFLLGFWLIYLRLYFYFIISGNSELSGYQ